VRTAIKGLCVKHQLCDHTMCVTHQTGKCHQSGPRPVTPSLTQTENTVVSHGERSKRGIQPASTTCAPGGRASLSKDPPTPQAPAHRARRRPPAPVLAPGARPRRTLRRGAPRASEASRARALEVARALALGARRIRVSCGPSRRSPSVRRLRPAGLPSLPHAVASDTRRGGQALPTNPVVATPRAAARTSTSSSLRGKAATAKAPCPAPLQRSVRRRAARRAIARSRSTMASRRRRGTRRLRSSPSNSAPSILEARPHRAA